MSTLFGVYNRNCRLLEAKIVAEMHRALSYWQPDESGRWLGGTVALGHEMLWNTPESKLEHLPLEQEQVVLTLDARLDNREELVTQLGLAGRPLQQLTDGEFILAAYCKWGEDCPKYLVGDFAFVLWDKAKQHLFCARDHLGVKPFYFHLTDALFVFANDIRGIVAHPDVSRTLCDEAVANYLVHTLLINKSLTFFKDIQKLPPAHSLTISATSTQQECYWRPEEAPKVTLPDAEAYAQKLRKLLEQAVRDRMRSDYPITSHLSGGLDSSAIAVIAARTLREKGERLLAFNWLHEPGGDDDPSHVEWAYSAAIAEIEDIEHSYVSLTSDDIVEYMARHNIAYGDSAGFWYEYPVRQAVKQHGSRTILSGWGGDELSTYHGTSYMANMMRLGNVREVVRGVWRDIAGRKRKAKLALKLLYHNVLMGFVPRQYYHRMPKSLSLVFAPLQFVRQSFLPVLNKEKAKTAVLSLQPHPTIKAHMLAFLQYGHLPARMESWAVSASVDRLEYSYPLLDKRIVEFILGTPAKFFVHKGVGRHLFRCAVADSVPHEILWSAKVVEVQRVNRLRDMSLSAYKSYIESLLGGVVDSPYIDFEKLRKALSASMREDEMVPLALGAGDALAVMRAEEEGL